MVYLIDANVLITAHNLYYPVNAVPEFWSWLSFRAAAGDIKMPLEIFEEVKDGGTDEERDLLFAWISEDENKNALILDEEVDPALVAQSSTQPIPPISPIRKSSRLGATHSSLPMR